MADMEMENDGDEQEVDEQEGEDETSFTDDHQPGDESVLIIDGSNPLFTRPDDEEREVWETSGSHSNLLKEIVIRNTEQFLKDEFCISVSKYDGPSSTILYDKLIVTKDTNNNKITRAEYKGKKILILESSKIRYSTNTRFAKTVGEFKELLMKAHKEHQKTAAAQVEEQLRAQGLGASKEHVDIVLEKTNEAVGERISESRDEVLSNPEITENERRELDGTFSPDEYRELSGVAREGLPKLTGDREVNKK